MSLRWKLVVLHAAVLTLVIAAIALALPITLRRTLVAAVDDELAARAATVGAATEIENGAWIVETKAGLEEDYAGDRGLYWVVRDASGALVAGSPLARNLGFAVGGPGIADARRSHAMREAGGRRFREFTRVVTKPADEDELLARNAHLHVLVGKDLAEADASVRALERQLLVVGPLVLLAAVFGGLLLSRRALAPIARIARTAEEIGARDLSRRVAVQGRDELARLGTTLNATFDRLQDAVERERRFTADASHELRTPLAVVAGAADLALRRPRAAEEYRQALLEIQAAAARMQGVVGGLLTLARADAGASPPTTEPVALRALADEVVLAHEPLAAQAGVELACEGDVALIHGDRERLRVLLANLVANAVRYNRPGGHATVRVLSERDRAVIEVEDDGAGIAPEHLPHLFERFYRADAHRSRDAGGAGLGLAIAQHVALSHGGTITVRSEPGRGTSFRVELPLAAAPAPHAVAGA